MDFDGTLSFGQWSGVGPANTELIAFFKRRKELGDKLILCTCRELDTLDIAVKWCEEQRLVFDAIYDNLPEKIEEYGINRRKISCNFYTSYVGAFKLSIDNEKYECYFIMI